MRSKILEGVPKLSFSTHCCPFPGSLHSVLTFLGSPPDYDFVMGVTGAAFRRFWNRDDGGNVDLMYLMPQPHERAFRALGWTYEEVPAADEAAVRDAFVASIDAGKPVLAFGIVGPPECGIVTGYENDGAVLRGWSYFQDAAVEGYFAREGWFRQAEWSDGLAGIILGERIPAQDPRETLVSSLEWALDLAHTSQRPERPNHVSGLAAYDAWADGLGVDADFPSDDVEVQGIRGMVHGDQCMMLDERRNGARFLRWGAGIAPEAAQELTAAADLYDQVAGTMPCVWLWGYDMGPEVGQSLADTEKRQGIAAGIRQARDLEAHALEQVQKALTELT